MLSHVDLNRVSQEELAEYKRRMEHKFQENRKLPGDPEFEYDKRVWSIECTPKDANHFVQMDFKPTQTSEWDD